MIPKFILASLATSTFILYANSERMIANDIIEQAEFIKENIDTVNTLLKDIMNRQQNLEVKIKEIYKNQNDFENDLIQPGPIQVEPIRDELIAIDRDPMIIGNNPTMDQEFGIIYKEDKASIKLKDIPRSILIELNPQSIKDEKPVILLPEIEKDIVKDEQIKLPINDIEKDIQKDIQKDELNNSPAIEIKEEIKGDQVKTIDNIGIEKLILPEQVIQVPNIESVPEQVQEEASLIQSVVEKAKKKMEELNQNLEDNFEDNE